MADWSSNLDALSEQGLVERLNLALGQTQPGAAFLSDELWRRRSARTEARMVHLTRRIEQLTWIVTAGTIGAVVIATAALLIAGK